MSNTWARKNTAASGKSKYRLYMYVIHCAHDPQLTRGGHLYAHTHNWDQNLIRLIIGHRRTALIIAFHEQASVKV